MKINRPESNQKPKIELQVMDVIAFKGKGNYDLTYRLVVKTGFSKFTTLNLVTGCTVGNDHDSLDALYDFYSDFEVFEVYRDNELVLGGLLDD